MATEATYRKFNFAKLSRYVMSVCLYITLNKEKLKINAIGKFKTNYTEFYERLIRTLDLCTLWIPKGI